MLPLLSLVAIAAAAAETSVNVTRVGLPPTTTSSAPALATTLSGFQQTLFDLHKWQDLSDGVLSNNTGSPKEIKDVNDFMVNTTTVIRNASAAIVQELDQLQVPVDPYYGEYYLGPIVYSVNTGLYSLIYNILGDNLDIFDNDNALALVDALNDLETLSSQLQLDESEIVPLVRAKVQLEYLISSPYANAISKSKRAESSSPDSFDELRDNLAYLGQDQDTLNQLLLSFEGLADSDAISAFINGTAIEIDNAISTLGNNQQTVSDAKDAGNNMLQPFIEYVTVGTEILISNIIASPDVRVIQDSDALEYSNALTRLTNSGLLNNVKYTTMENLEMVQRQFIDLTYANPQYTPASRHNTTSSAVSSLSTKITSSVSTKITATTISSTKASSSTSSAKSTHTSK